jgi:hypothetical protein
MASATLSRSAGFSLRRTRTGTRMHSTRHTPIAARCSQEPNTNWRDTAPGEAVTCRGAFCRVCPSTEDVAMAESVYLPAAGKVTMACHAASTETAWPL